MLHVWDKPYCRLSAQDFTLDTKDKLVHLTNQSIQVKIPVTASMRYCVVALQLLLHNYF